MLFIDSESEKVKVAKEEHYMAVQCLVNKKLGLDKCGNDDCKICKSKIHKVKHIPDKLRTVLSDSLNIRLLITTKDLEHFNQELWDCFFSGISQREWAEASKENTTVLSEAEQGDYRVFLSYYFNSISKIFDYDGWFNNASTTTNYGAYFLAKKLNRRTCTYCNRQYTNTMVKRDGGKLMRPQFDHWYPKSKFPLLALSFYNLIPSCSVCNSSSKGSTLFNTDSHIHPYIDKDQTESFEFDYEYDKSIEGKKILVNSIGKNGDKAIETLKALSIDTMYNAHISELNDLILIKNKYPGQYIQKLQEAFPELHLTEEEIYRLFFGTELYQKNFHKRPFSKFKYDILQQLK